MPKLTETFVSKLAHPEAGTRKYWDTEVKGFGLFVGKRSKTWYYQRDVGGQTRRVLIGRHSVISAAAARQAAQTLALDMSRGAGKVFQTGAPTLERAMEAFLARPKLRSEAFKNSVRGSIRIHLGDWLRLPLNEITRSMVAARHGQLAHIPSGANHMFRAFRSIWNHARRTSELPETPTLAIEWYDEEPDGRIIEKLAEWRDTVDALENPIHAAYYRFLLFTGLRKSEAAALRWRDVAGDRIHIPVTKNGRPFDLPILGVHHAILDPMRRLHQEWVFPARRSASGYLKNPKQITWSPHAHRRTFATVAMEAGVIEEIVGRLLNHTPVSITGHRYVRPSLDALRPAMESICSELSARISANSNSS